MIWIKRNLFIVVGAVLSLALLGGAGFYLYSSSEENYQRDDALAVLKQELDGLQTGNFPSDANIALVKSNIAGVNAFMADAERLMVSEVPKPMTVAQFNINLARAIDELRREATNAGVDIPPKYEFTFGEVKVMTGLPTYALPPLISQLSEVRTINGVLFKAKVRAVESLRRVKAFEGEQVGADLLTERAQQTNSLSPTVNVLITPYRVIFRGFTADLAAVINGFSSTKEFIVVRQIDVEQAGGSLDTPSPMMAPGGPLGMMAPAGLPNPGLPGAAMNAGAPMAPGARPPPPKAPPGAPTVAPAPKSNLTLVLNEKPLRFTLALDVVKVVRKPAPVGGPAPVPAPSSAN
ncbi:MAG: hypothetical protein RL514_677 [Verrucomicrobiota bacterium]|jgi:hypothetical protein